MRFVLESVLLGRRTGRVVNSAIEVEGRGMMGTKVRAKGERVKSGTKVLFATRHESEWLAEKVLADKTFGRRLRRLDMWIVQMDARSIVEVAARRQATLCPCPHLPS